MNSFGVTKRTLSDKLYDVLCDEVSMNELMPDDQFAEYFAEVLEDYVLALKSGIIE